MNFRMFVSYIKLMFSHTFEYSYIQANQSRINCIYAQKLYTRAPHSYSYLCPTFRQTPTYYLAMRAHMALCCCWLITLLSCYVYSHSYLGECARSGSQRWQHNVNVPILFSLFDAYKAGKLFARALCCSSVFLFFCWSCHNSSAICIVRILFYNIYSM